MKKKRSQEKSGIDFPFLFAVAVVLSLAFVVVPAGPRVAARMFLASAHYFVGLNVVLVLAILVGKMRREPARFFPPWRELAPPVIASIFLTVLVFARVDHRFRIVMDEPCLASVAQGLYLKGKAGFIEAAIRRDGALTPTEIMVPQRPLLFPLFVLALHWLRGYSAYNGFVVNAVATAAVLFLVAWLGYRLHSLALGLLAAALTAAFPLFALNATSSGYDILNLAFLLVTGLQLFRFLEEPSALELELLALVGALAAQCRHETALLLIPIFAAGYLKRREIARDRAPFLVLVVPFLLIPMAWQKLVVPATNRVDEQVVAFSLDYVTRNLGAALEFFFNPHGMGYATSPAIACLGAIGLTLALFALRKRGRRESRTAREMLGLSLVGVGLVALAQMAYYLGDLRLAFNARFALAYLGCLSLAAAYALERLWRHAFGKAAVAAGLVLLLAQGLSVAVKDDPSPTMPLVTTYRRNLEVLKPLPPETTLVITAWPTLYTIHRYASVGFEYANRHAEEIRQAFRRGEYREIIAVQERGSEFESRQPEKEDLGDAFSLSPIESYPFGQSSTVQLSRVLPRNTDVIDAPTPRT